MVNLKVLYILQVISNNEHYFSEMVKYDINLDLEVHGVLSHEDSIYIGETRRLRRYKITKQGELQKLQEIMFNNLIDMKIGYLDNNTYLYVLSPQLGAIIYEINQDQIIDTFRIAYQYGGFKMEVYNNTLIILFTNY